MLREKAKDWQTAAPGTPVLGPGEEAALRGSGSVGNGVGDLYRVTQRQNQVLAPKPVLFASYHTASKTSFASCLGTEDHPALGVHPPQPPLSGKTQAGLGRSLGHGAGRAASDGQRDRQAAPGLLPTWEAFRRTAGARRTQHLSKPVYQPIPGFVFHRLTPSGLCSPLPHHLMLERL